MGVLGKTTLCGGHRRAGLLPVPGLRPSARGGGAADARPRAVLRLFSARGVSAGTCTQPSRPCAPADLGEQPPQRHRLLHGPRGGSASRRPLQCPAELWRHPDHLGEDRLPGLPAEDGAHRRQRRSALRGPSPPQGCTAPGASCQPAHRPAGSPHPGARCRMCRRRCSLETSVSPRLPLTALARARPLPRMWGRWPEAVMCSSGRAASWAQHQRQPLRTRPAGPVSTSVARRCCLRWEMPKGSGSRRRHV